MTGEAPSHEIARGGAAMHKRMTRSTVAGVGPDPAKPRNEADDVSCFDLPNQATGEPDRALLSTKSIETRQACAAVTTISIL